MSSNGANAKQIESDVTRDNWSISDNFQSCTDFIDRHLQLFRTGSTVAACVGLLFIIRSTRMLKTFVNINDIPAEFVKKNVWLRGKVVLVQDSHLHVEHLPIVDVRRFTLRRGRLPAPSTGLKVYLAGVSMLNGSQQFLHNRVPAGQLMWFQILARNEDHPGIEAIVTMKQNWWKTTNLNEAVLLSGHGKVTALPPIINRKLGIRITQRLLGAELAAEKAKQGVWREDTKLDKCKAMVSTTWNSSIRLAKGIAGVGSKVISVPTTAYRRIRHYFQNFKKR